ncbi:hypothetical protein [Phenylobacterium sp.]|uniref:hypothetical protein n=1 Tax=Phenylobacterium sp. TaxID=1871053 RepID=UPI002FD8ABFC
MFRILSLVACGLLVTGCATTYSLSPVAGEGQQVTYDRGIATVASEGEKAVVRVAPTATVFDARMTLGVVAYNLSEEGVNLGVENVRVFTAAGAPVRVYSYEQLEKEAKNAAAWQTFAVALSAASQAYSASQPTTVNTYGSVYGSGGYASYSGHTTVYNPANAALANAAAQAQADRRISNIRADLDATLAGLGSVMLRTTTVPPGQIFGGNVVAERPVFAKDEAPRLKVVVDFAGEEHEFEFGVGPG